MAAGHYDINFVGTYGILFHYRPMDGKSDSIRAYLEKVAIKLRIHINYADTLCVYIASYITLCTSNMSI